MGHAIESEKLRDAIEQIAREQRTVACAVSVRDCESGANFSFHGDRLFHAASTIKVAILLALFKAIDDGRIRATDPLHVRNRFLSAHDQTPFQLDAETEARAASSISMNSLG